jgi:CDP-diacylglycerol---glycerol-3-phosphate 3-phosphatidyltransferase
VNPPNVLTLSRLVLAFVLMPLLLVPAPYFKTAALLVFIVGGISDYLDGRLARTVYGESAFGKLMDPVTDKVLVCAAFISFVELQLVSAVVVVIIVAREFTVTGLRLLALSEGQVIAAGTWGKHKTVWQIVAIILILFGLAVMEDVLPGLAPAWGERVRPAFEAGAHAVSIAVAGVTVWSGAMYMRAHRGLVVGRI